MHTVRLKLKTTKSDEQIIEKRFHILSHIHNVMVKYAKKLLRKLSYDKEYQTLNADYTNLLKKTDELSTADEKLKKALSSRMHEILTDIGLTKTGFETYIKVCGKQFSKHISSQQVQKEAGRVWQGVEKVLFGNGNDIHFKKYDDFSTISGKSHSNGIKFDKETKTISWLGLNIKCKVPSDNAYIQEALSSDISYCELKRKMFPNGWHYYVIIYLKGDAPHKQKSVGNRDNITGIDIGTSTVAGVSDNTVTLKALAPKSRKYEKQIKRLLKRMDISKRISNPNKYNPDGTIKKGNHDKWKYSKNYIKNRRRLKYLYEKKAAYIKQSHEETIKELLKDSVVFIAEKMNFKALQKRTKKTEKSEKVSDVKQKDGSVKQVQKFKKKKRFGRSLGNRAPSAFMTKLQQKAQLYGGNVYYVDTKKFKASQYNHVTDEYTKHSLNERQKQIGGHTVQRDLYSAFLLKNSNNDLTTTDRDKCIYGFEKFIKLQDKLLSEMKEQNISMKQCFGF